MPKSLREHSLHPRAQTKQHCGAISCNMGETGLSMKGPLIAQPEETKPLPPQLLSGPYNSQDGEPTRGHFPEATDSKDIITMLFRGYHGLYILSRSHT